MLGIVLHQEPRPDEPRLSEELKRQELKRRREACSKDYSLKVPYWVQPPVHEQLAS